MSNNEKYILNIELAKGNIIEIDCDCIVNAANSSLVAGGGVCGAIFKAAGYDELTYECQKIGYCPTGSAVITSGCNLKQRYIIHAVGPVYKNDASAKYLKKVYESILELADRKGIKTIAIPSISTGIYGYPKKEACQIALEVVMNFHATSLSNVILVSYDDEGFKLYQEELNRQKYLNKVKGCILGGAMGDALGYPVEFHSYQEILDEFGEGGIRDYKLTNGKAVISDDTQMTLFTLEGLLIHKDICMNGLPSNPIKCIYNSYLNWLETQGFRVEFGDHIYSKIKGIEELNVQRAPGSTCLSALLSGEMGTIEKPINNSKGCGGAMRVAPIGLFGNDDLSEDDLFSKLGAEAAAITHGHSLGYIPAAFLVSLIRLLVIYHSEMIHFTRAVNIAYEITKKTFGLDKHFKEFENLIFKACDLALNEDVKDIDAIEELGEGWVAEEAVAIALYCAIRYRNDFAGGIEAAVNHSGDSDSTGAICGNILGAHLGYNKIPMKYKNNLELKNLMKELAKNLCDN